MLYCCVHISRVNDGVKNVCHDRGDQVFIKSMVELAGVFGMKTVAEWVGDAPTAKFLTDAGIDYLQGFYFAEPAPPETFLGLHKV